MAGKGFAPKKTKARRNADGGMTVVNVDPFPQPALGRLMAENSITGEPWHPVTLRMWKALKEFPTLATLQEAQWLSLLTAMQLQDSVYRGEAKNAPEARLRLAKFGIDPDDVLRMRINMSVAESAELNTSEKRKKASTGKELGYIEAESWEEL